MVICIIAILLIAEFLFEKSGYVKKKVLKQLETDKLIFKMRLLHNEREISYRKNEFLTKKIRVFMFILIGGCILAEGCTLLNNMNPVIGEKNDIKRNSFGMGSKKLSVYVEGDELEKEKINIEISDRIHEDDETERLFLEMEQKLDKVILGGNRSFECIDENLNLIDKMEGYPFKISYRSEKPLLISNKGVLNKKKIKEYLKENETDSIILNFNLTIKYEDFKREKEYAFRLISPKESGNEKEIWDITEEIREIDTATRKNESLILPREINGKKISYITNENETNRIIIILSVVSGLATYFLKDKDLDVEIEKRNEQLNEDYPRIINQYTLYYCAGMHPKAIWQEICRDYRNRLQKGSEKRYAYEEILRAEALMSDGMNEIESYHLFAKECGNRKYKEFVSLIEQSLVKGKEDIKSELRKEAWNAQSDKITRAKIKGEEAGTKLLVPMFMMLLVVLIIVIVPAFMNFNM